MLDIYMINYTFSKS